MQCYVCVHLYIFQYLNCVQDEHRYKNEMKHVFIWYFNCIKTEHNDTTLVDLVCVRMCLHYSLQYELTNMLITSKWTNMYSQENMALQFYV